MLLLKFQFFKMLESIKTDNALLGVMDIGNDNTESSLTYRWRE